jgi:hypothetical protein
LEDNMQINSFSVHACGNGKVLTYHHNADVFQFFGPFYSLPSFGEIRVTDKYKKTFNDMAVEKEPNTNFYTYNVKGAVIKDFCFSEAPVFVRDIEGDDIVHTISVHDYVMVKDVSFKYGKSDVKVFELKIISGTYIYFSYPLVGHMYASIVISNANGENITFDGRNIYLEGGGRIAFVAGGHYPDTVEETKKYFELNVEDEKKKARDRYAEYFNNLPDFESMIPLDMPMRDTLLKAIESNVINIKTQQHEEGGVIAGYPYHLGYVRDQYGVVRGMLKLGMKEEALGVLYFFLNEFKREGRINNAHGMGLRGVMHIHENDDVEITGYIVLMFFDYLGFVEDEGERRRLFDEFLPLLKWALEAQISQVVNGMLPFNGDETYIAGGILPRNAIFDGSSEATLMFIDSALKFMNEVKRLGIDFDVSHIKEKVDECRKLYARNFFVDGKLITNNPDRITDDEKPMYRHGVCEGYCGYFGWIEKSKEALYLCVDCLEKEVLGEREFRNHKKVHKLKSVLLLPIFINSTVITINDIMNEIYEISLKYLETGRIPSASGMDRNLGYDFGFLLGSLNEVMKVIDKEDERFDVFLRAIMRIYEDTLNLVDRTYTWCEYYNDLKSSGTQYRPWESAINIKALIEFAENFNIIKEYIEK